MPVGGLFMCRVNIVMVTRWGCRQDSLSLYTKPDEKVLNLKIQENKDGKVKPKYKKEILGRPVPLRNCKS